jgi:hypothetical protein
MTIFRRIGAPPGQQPVQQEPVIEDIPVVEEAPVLRHGVVAPNVAAGADGLGARTTDGGLSPPAPSSVEPSGIPTRATDDAEPIPVGEEADAAGPAKELPPIGAQVPDAVPAMPPPSKTEVETDVPAVDIPVPVDVPVIEVSMPDVVPLELGKPNDVCGIEPPTPEHVVTLLVVSPSGDVPDVNGLTPGDASSVAPMGIPVGATGAPGPMPSGDVMPSAGPGEIFIPPTCAEAGPQLRRATAVTAIDKRVIVTFSSFRIEAALHRGWLYARLRW